MPDDPVIEFMIRHTGLLATLLGQHIDDGTGHCATCSGGPQAGRPIWPCQTRGYATRASEVERRRDQVQWRST